MSDPYPPDHTGQQTPPGPVPQPGPAPQPGYASPQPGYGPPPGYGYPPYGYPQPPTDPGQAMGIVGFVLAFVFSPAGIVFSAVGRSQSKQAGFDNQLATWGFWLSIIFTALAVLYVLFWVLLVFGGLFTALTVGGTGTTASLSV